MNVRVGILIFAIAAMSVFSSYGKKDTPFITDGDTQFVGMNNKLDPASLQPGQVYYAINQRFLNGTAATRLGFTRPAWANAVDYGQILGAAVYSNPNGEEVILIATPTMVYKVSETATTALTIPVAYQSLVWPVEFTQAFNKMLLFPAPGQLRLPLVWDGIGTAFVPVTKLDPLDTSTVLIPKSIPYGAMFENRLLFPLSHDEMAMSDVLDYTSYDPILSVFRLNTGRSDRLVAIVPYPHGSVILFMDNSILQLSNFAIDPSQAELQILNSNLGLASRRSVAMVGGDIIFLSKPGGVYRLSEVIQGKIATAPVPISDAIQPVIDRINWPYVPGVVTGATAIMHGRYYQLAVPLGTSQTNHQALIYDTVTSEWQSIDQWYNTGTPVHLYLSKVSNGARRLFMTDFTNSVYLLDEDHDGIDHAASGDSPIRAGMVTRGYARAAIETNSNQNFRRVQALVSAANADTAVYTLLPDYNDVSLIGRIQRNRLKYYTWSHADWNPTNINNDFNDPFRQDYFATAAELAAMTPPPTAPSIGTVPTTYSSRQTWLERWPARAIGKFLQLIFITQQGVIEVKNVAVESIPSVIGRGESADVGIPPPPPPPPGDGDGGGGTPPVPNWAGQDFESMALGDTFTLPSASAYSGDCRLGPGGYLDDGLNWAADDFEIYDIGDVPALPRPINNGDTSLGTGGFWAFPIIDNYAFDLFEAYATGSVTSLTLNTDVNSATLGSGFFF